MFESESLECKKVRKNSEMNQYLKGQLGGIRSVPVSLIIKGAALLNVAQLCPFVRKIFLD
jgi:hypothetical protein